MIITRNISPVEIILFACLGWLIGLLINYLADVLPVTRRISQPSCLFCANPITILDYFLLRNCRQCCARRSFRTWVVQIGSVLFVVGLGVIVLRRIGFWIAIPLYTYFALIAVIDIEYKIILNPLSLVGVIGGTLLGWMLNGFESTVLGGLAGFLIMLGLYFLGKLFVRIVNRSNTFQTDETALGFGDVNLSGVIGLMLGWMDIIGGLLIAILLGGIISGLIMLLNWIARRYRPMTAIPYGPFLIIGAMIYLFIPAFY